MNTSLGSAWCLCHKCISSSPRKSFGSVWYHPRCFRLDQTYQSFSSKTMSLFISRTQSVPFLSSIESIFSSQRKITFRKIYYSMFPNVMILFTMHVSIKAKCWFIGMPSTRGSWKSVSLYSFSVEGKSRSPSIACLYIMTITGLSWSDAINSLRGVRTLVDPNFAFQKQLKHFYDKLMSQVDRSGDQGVGCTDLSNSNLFRNVNGCSTNSVPML